MLADLTHYSGQPTRIKQGLEVRKELPLSKQREGVDTGVAAAVKTGTARPLRFYPLGDSKVQQRR